MWQRAVEAIEADVQSKGVARRKWSTVKKWADRKSVTAEQRVELQQALEAKGLFIRPRLDIVNPKGADFVAVTRRKYEKWENGFRFPNEEALRQAVMNNQRHLPGLADLYAIEREVAVEASGKRLRIDLLAKRPSRVPGSTHWVLVEFERFDGHGETATQLLRYLRAFRRSAKCREGDIVEAMVISQSMDELSYEQLDEWCSSNDVAFSWLVTSMELVEARPAKAADRSGA